MAKGVESFCGARLTQAREIRGLTGTNLAAIIGISSASLSQYEHDTASPTQDVIDRMAEALNVRPTFFLRRYTESEPVFFYRSLSSATKQARKRAMRKYEWLTEFVSYFESVFDFPELRLPQFQAPQSIDRVSMDDIENYAKLARAFWGLGESPVPNVIHLLERSGVVVTRIPLEADSLDGLSEWRASARPVFIIASDKASAVRSRFDAAHELAHYLIHRDIVARPPEVHASMEGQAHRFAAAFLLPREAYLKDLVRPSLESFAALKGRWKASIAMQIHRCFDLGIIDEDGMRRLFISLSKRGWRRQEPGDDKIPAESPRLFRQCIDAMLQSGFKTRQQIADDLERSPKDVEEICGLPEGYLREGFGEIIPLASFKSQPQTPQSRPGDIVSLTF